MKEEKRISVSFQNSDTQGRVRLNTRGTFRDLQIHDIKLEPGLELLLYEDDDLITTGIVQFSEEEKIWVAVIDWDQLG